MMQLVLIPSGQHVFRDPRENHPDQALRLAKHRGKDRMALLQCSHLDERQTLTMGGSGNCTSGMLHFKNPQGDYFLVTRGVHNSKLWTSKPSNTSVEIQPTCYADVTGGVCETLWKHLTNLERTTSKGVLIKVEYVEDGNITIFIITSIN
jgi:hypothetical protein